MCSYVTTNSITSATGTWILGKLPNLSYPYSVPLIDLKFRGEIGLLGENEWNKTAAASDNDQLYLCDMFYCEL